MRFEIDGKQDFEKLPTFIQFCKQSNGKALPQVFFVTKIWLPNQFPSATLETEKFRVRISSKSPVWDAISEQIPVWESSGVALAITEISTENYTYTLALVEEEECEWDRLSDTGIKLTVRDKPKRKRSKNA